MFFDLILQKHAYGIRQLVKRLDPGKVTAVNRLCGCDVLVCSGKNADHGDPVRPGASHFKGRIADTALFFIVDELLAVPGTDAHDVVWLCVGENDEDAVIKMLL